MHAVVDASVFVEVIVSVDGRPRRWLLDVLDGDDIYWVEGLTLLEVASALRKLERRGSVDEDVASAGLRWLANLVVKHKPLGQAEMIRVWELRHSVTPYDAAYLALAESLQSGTGGNACFVTADAKLAQAPGILCPVELYTAHG